MKINFTHEIFISQIDWKQFTYEILFLYVKLHVKFMLENRVTQVDGYLLLVPINTIVLVLISCCMVHTGCW